MKVGIVGCGLNYDYHINFAMSYPGAVIVGIVDKDQHKALECAKKHGVQCYVSIKDLVETTKPDVIHVVTPPQTHFALVKEALELKCNVLVEKPMALNLREAEGLFSLAEKNEVNLCTMHNHFFDPCMANVNELVKNGNFGKIVNVESYYGINAEIPAFKEYPAPNIPHWVYSLPGGVYHDFMAHPLYVMLEYTGKPKNMKVMKKTFGTLPHGIPDEIKIMIDGTKAFGTLTFSFVAKPHLHFLQLYGTKMVAKVDFNTMVNVIHPVSSLPKAAQKATYNLSESWQLFTETTTNMFNFVRGTLKPYHGMKCLIHSFYDFVNGKGEIPVTKEQALLVMETMDEIWQQLKPKPLNFDPIIPQQLHTIKHKEKILVTGGTGFLGKKIVERLVAEGYQVRVLARKLSRIEPVKEMGVEIFFGDVGDLQSLDVAFEGVQIVLHAAADTVGTERGGEVSTIQGTRNVLDLSKKFKINKLVYISSCSVYGVADYKEGEIVTEDASLERFPERRGHYSLSKLKAEHIITEAMTSGQLPIVCLRPGTYFGPGGDIYTPMMGLKFGTRLFMIIGNGKFVLPLIYIDNLVDAIIASIEKDEGVGKIYNVVDSDIVTKRDYVNTFLRKIYPGARFFYMPYSLFYLLVYMQEVLTKILKRNPFLTRYRIVSSQKNIRYNSDKIKKELNWIPPYTLGEAMNSVIEYEREGKP